MIHSNDVAHQEYPPSRFLLLIVDMYAHFSCGMNPPHKTHPQHTGQPLNFMHTHFHDVKWRVSLNAGMTCDLYKNQKKFHASEFQLHHATRESNILNCVPPFASYLSPSNFLVHIQLVGACLPLH